MLSKLFIFILAKRCMIGACLFFILMVVIGSIPGNAIALSSRIDDRILHFFSYFFVSCLIFLGSHGSTAARAIRTLLLVALLGASDEAIQFFMPYRTADWSDLGVDLLAAAIALSAIALLNIIISKPKTVQHRTTICRGKKQTD